MSIFEKMASSLSKGFDAMVEVVGELGDLTANLLEDPILKKLHAERREIDLQISRRSGEIIAEW